LLILQQTLCEKNSDTARILTSENKILDDDEDIPSEDEDISSEDEDTPSEDEGNNSGDNKGDNEVNGERKDDDVEKSLKLPRKRKQSMVSKFLESSA
jgi:hypothetical protein